MFPKQANIKKLNYSAPIVPNFSKRWDDHIVGFYTIHQYKDIFKFNGDKIHTLLQQSRINVTYSIIVELPFFGHSQQ